MLELNIASSDIALQLISLLEARVDAWNLQATDRHTDPWNRLCSLGHLTDGVYPRHLKLCRRPTYAPQVSHDPWSSPDFRLPTPSSSSTPATSPARTNCRSFEFTGLELGCHIGGKQYVGDVRWGPAGANLM